MAFVHVRSFSKQPTGAPEGGPTLSLQNVLFGIPFGTVNVIPIRVPEERLVDLVEPRVELVENQLADVAV